MAWNQWFIHKLLFILLFITYYLAAIFLLFSNIWFLSQIAPKWEYIYRISNQYSASAAASTTPHEMRKKFKAADSRRQYAPREFVIELERNAKHTTKTKKKKLCYELWPKKKISDQRRKEKKNKYIQNKQFSLSCHCVFASSRTNISCAPFWPEDTFFQWPKSWALASQPAHRIAQSEKSSNNNIQPKLTGTSTNSSSAIYALIRWP